MASKRALIGFLLFATLAQLVVAADSSADSSSSSGESNAFVKYISIILGVSIVLAVIVFLLTWCNKKTFPWLAEWEYACAETCDCLRGVCSCCCCFKAHPAKKLEEEPYSEEAPEETVVDNVPKLKAPPEFMQKVVDENFY